MLHTGIGIVIYYHDISSNSCKKLSLLGFLFYDKIHGPNSTWERKGLYHTNSSTLHFIIKELKARIKWSRSHGELLTPGLFLMVFSASFLIKPSTSSPELELPIVNKALPHQPSIKKMLHTHAYRPILWRHFPN